MRVVRVNSADCIAHGRPCRKCHEPAAVGQVVLHLDLGDGIPYDQRHVVFHKSCLQEVLDNAPAPRQPKAVRREIDKISASILSSGTLFPQART